MISQIIIPRSLAKRKHSFRNWPIFAWWRWTYICRFAKDAKFASLETMKFLTRLKSFSLRRERKVHVRNIEKGNIYVSKLVRNVFEFSKQKRLLQTQNQILTDYYCLGTWVISPIFPIYTGPIFPIYIGRIVKETIERLVCDVRSQIPSIHISACLAFIVFLVEIFQVLSIPQL